MLVPSWVRSRGVTPRWTVDAHRVRPFISEELKHGWIQYLSFFVISLYLVDWLKWYVYSRGLVPSFVTTDGKPTKMLHVS